MAQTSQRDGRQATDIAAMRMGSVYNIYAESWHFIKEKPRVYYYGIHTMLIEYNQRVIRRSVGYISRVEAGDGFNPRNSLSTNYLHNGYMLCEFYLMSCERCSFHRQPSIQQVS